MKRTEAIRLGEFTMYALAGEKGPASRRVGSNVVRALRYYLADRDAGRADWPCPTFLSDADGGGIEVELAVDDALWRSLEQEAERQGVPVRRLVEHAALYFAANRDAGRLTQSMLEDLDEQGKVL